MYIMTNIYTFDVLHQGPEFSYNCTMVVTLEVAK